MWSESQSQCRHKFLKWCLFSQNVFLTDWQKRALRTMIFVTKKWTDLWLRWYSIPSTISGGRKTFALTYISFACIIIAFLIFSPTSIGVVLFVFALVYFKAIQHLFLSLGQDFPKFIVFLSLLFRKFR